jgi:DNA polymerase I
LTQAILSLRTLTRRLRTMEEMGKGCDPVTGRLHGNLDPLGTKTGRYTCSSPNLLGLDETLRELVVARDDHVLLLADYSQMQLRILAQLSEDPGLLEVYRTPGGDLHRRTAAAIFTKSEYAVTNEQRGVGKTINFAILFGMTPASLAADLDVDLSQAEGLIQGFFGAFPGVATWAGRIHEEAERQGFVRTLCGRRRRLDGFENGHEGGRSRLRRQAVSSVIQGTEADIFKMALARLSSELPRDCRLLLPIHDAVLVEVPRKRIEEAAKIVRSVMESPPPGFSVRLAVDVRCGASWGTCKKMERSA